MPVTDLYEFEPNPGSEVAQNQTIEDIRHQSSRDIGVALSLAAITLPIAFVAEFVPAAAKNIKQDAISVWKSEVKGIKSLVRALRK